MADDFGHLAAGNDYKKRERCTWAAWIKPKAAENAFIYAMLGLDCPVILCFRAKEKLKIIPGKEPIDLGWQPFETIFTVVLPPHSKGVPSMEFSEARKPFDTMLGEYSNRPLDEDLGRRLTEWARGGGQIAQSQSKPETCDDDDFKDIGTATADAGLSRDVVAQYINTLGFKSKELPKSKKAEVLAWIEQQKRKRA